MIMPPEIIEDIKNSWPYFQDWGEERKKKEGLLAWPSGKDLIIWWYEFCYEHSEEVKEQIVAPEASEAPDA